MPLPLVKCRLYQIAYDNENCSKFKSKKLKNALTVRREEANGATAKGIQRRGASKASMTTGNVMNEDSEQPILNSRLRESFSGC